MSNTIEFVLIALFAVFVCIESQTRSHSLVNPTHCGVSRQLLDDEPNECFEWHRTRATMGKMMNGRNISYGEAPWIVYVNMGCSFTGGYGERTCGGSLIADQWVLTAAYCISRCQGRSAVNKSIEFKVVNITVISGYQIVYSEWKEHRNDSQWLADHDLEVRDVDDWKLHPNYKTKGFPNLTGDGNNYGVRAPNLALLRLLTPIESNPVLRNTICLPTKNYFESVGSYLMTAGYGFKGKPEDLYKRFPAQVSYAVTKPTDFPTMMITVSPEGAGDLCNYDEGGPLWQFINGKAVLVGVNSYYSGTQGVSGCGGKGQTINTRVSFYIDWIIDVMERYNSSIQKTF